MNILFVDDDARTLEFYKAAIDKLYGINAFYCETCEDGLKLAAENEISVFILDVILPDMSGFQFANRIRNTTKYFMTPILFVTGNTQNALIAFKKYHCYDYITKPFNMNQLCDKIKKILGNEVSHEEKFVRKELVHVCNKNGEFFLQKLEVLFLEQQNNRCIVHTRDKKIVNNSSLIKMIETLNMESIVRCHKSFAINIFNIDEIKQINYRLWQVTFKNTSKTADIGLTYYYNLNQQIQKLMLSRNEEN